MDIEDRLNERRNAIMARLTEMGAHPRFGTRGAREQPQLLQELLSIEQILTQISATLAQERATENEIEQQQRRDNAEFWSRKFYLSLAIGNGAGFGIVTTALLQSGNVYRAIVFAWAPLLFFGPGLLAAGSIPMWQYLQRRHWNRPRLQAVIIWSKHLATAISTALFIAAIVQTIGAVNGGHEAATKLAKAAAVIEGAELRRKLAAVESEASKAQVGSRQPPAAPR